MKKISKLLLLCLAVCMIFTACGRNVKTKTFTCEGLTIELPANCKAFSGEAADAYTFAMTNNKITVMGLREEKAAFEAYGLNPTLEEYADLVCQANSKQMSRSTYNGQILLEYESLVNGNTFRYMASVYESEDAFWLIQYACLEKDFEEYRGDFFAGLMSVQP